LAMLQLLQ